MVAVYALSDEVAHVTFPRLEPLSLEDVGQRVDMQRFQGWLRDERYSPDTIALYFGYANRASAFIGHSLRSATTEELMDWLRSLPATASSWNQGRKALVAFYRYIDRKAPPTLDVPVAPEQRRLPRPLTVEDHAQFLAASKALGGEYRAMGLLFATTGARFSEVQRARWEQFQLDGRAPTWRIEGKGSGRRGPKHRVIPIHTEIVAALIAWRRACGSPVYVLPGSRGWVSDSAMRLRFRDICDLAGLSGVTPHMLRHTVATAALESSGNLRSVGELLGHANLNTTAAYTAVSPSRLRGLVEALPA
jgi:integrase